MNLLIKQAVVIDPTSKYNNQTKDILIENGIIKKVEDKISVKNVEVFEADNLHIAPGFFDIGTHTCDPGLEFREDLATATKAASAGGFTGVAVLPNNNPIADNKSAIEYILQQNKNKLVAVFPMGAISPKAKGETLAELQDMHQSGAVGFTDGLNALQHSGVLLRALRYVLPFDGLILQQPNDEKLSEHGVMNESESAVQLGMFGIPQIAETAMVQRDLFLCEYTNSKIHFFNLTTQQSVDLLKSAKAKKIKATAGISPIYLLLDDSMLEDFDTHFKLMPPLRTKTDIQFLKNALKENVFDVVCSWHQPKDTEEKQVEFDHALFGAINLQTCFAALNTAMHAEINLDAMIQLLSINPRKILNLTIPTLTENNNANFTLFNPEAEFVLEEKNILSKSKNSPLIGMKLKGKILGTMNNSEFEKF